MIYDENIGIISSHDITMKHNYKILDMMGRVTQWRAPTEARRAENIQQYNYMIYDEKIGIISSHDITMKHNYKILGSDGASHAVASPHRDP